MYQRKRDNRKRRLREGAINHFVTENTLITLDQAVDLIGVSFTSNARSETSKLLSGMVEKGQIRRVKNGVFVRNQMI